MKVKFKKVPVNKIMLTADVSLIDCDRLIDQTMNLGARVDYAHAMMQVQQGNPLEKSDLELFDHVDKVTSKYLGITLKDSKVTRARVDACKKYGIEFLDRGGLIDHMNMVEAAKNN